MPPLPDEELLRRLVAFDTTSHRSNLELIDFVAGYIDGPAVEVRRVVSGAGDKANLLCRVGPDSAERAGITLCGHTDVVPALESGWESEPFDLVHRDDRWVARGSCDMKGFLAAAIQLFVEFSERQLAAPLGILLTYDEEVGSLGVQRLAEVEDHEILPRAMIIGEPTDLRVIRTHKGHLRLEVETRGLSAHSGYPDRGENAIEPAAEIVRALGRLRRELAAERVPASEQFPRVPFAALNVATIEGGAAVNVIPDRCRVEVGVRLLPGVDADAVVERVRAAATAAVGGADWRLTTVNVSPPLELAEDAPIHRHLCSHVGQDGGASADFSSDGGTLSTIGFDCVLFGPGSIEVAHKPNEFLPIREYRAARSLLEGLLHERCRALGG